MPAEQGRNFVAEFEIYDVLDHGSSVDFELRLKVINYSGRDLKEASFALSAPLPFPARDAVNYRGSFSNVSIPDRKLLDLQGDFSAPKAEYQRWQRGALPNLVVTFLDESGRERHERVELHHPLMPFSKGAPFSTLLSKGAIR
jgi:hypothetical protein